MLHRRDAMIRFGLGGLTLSGLLGARNTTASTTTPAKAKSCIYLFLWGGPPQNDLWDLKPGAPEGIRSIFQPIRTNVPGITIGDQMPQLARHMDKVALVRSLSHPSNNHEPSVYYMLTGHQDPTLVVPRNQRKRSDFPSIASVAGYFTSMRDVPASFTIPRPIGHNGVTYSGTYAGFLGPRYDSFELVNAPNSNENSAPAMTLPVDVNATRLVARRGLLNLIEEEQKSFPRSRMTDGLQGFHEQAIRMVTSPAAKRAVNVDLEPPAIRDRYGRNEYGESLLLARRLIEAGVRFVTVTWMYIFPGGRVANVWDNHSGLGIHGAKTGFDLLKSPVCIPPLDRGLSALLEDMSESGLLENTLIAAAGEFGRTPKINPDGGREHWGACQTALLAGGGIRGGQIYGSSDKRAEYVKDKPVSPPDFLATIYHALGLSPEMEVRDRDGRPYRICDGNPVTDLFG